MRWHLHSMRRPLFDNIQGYLALVFTAAALLTGPLKAPACLVFSSFNVYFPLFAAIMYHHKINVFLPSYYSGILISKQSKFISNANTKNHIEF